MSYLLETSNYVGFHCSRTLNCNVLLTQLIDVQFHIQKCHHRRNLTNVIVCAAIINVPAAVAADQSSCFTPVRPVQRQVTGRSCVQLPASVMLMGNLGRSIPDNVVKQICLDKPQQLRIPIQ